MPVSLDIDNGYIKIIEGEQSNNKIKIKPITWGGFYNGKSL